MLVRAKRDDGWDTHAKANREWAGWCIKLAFFLAPDHLLHRRAAATAHFFWPSDFGVTGFRFRGLPFLGTGHELFARDSLAQRFSALRLQVLFQEAAGLSAEFGFFGCIVEIHLSFSVP